MTDDKDIVRVIVDERTGEEVPIPGPKQIPGFLAQISVDRLGTLQLTESEIDELTKPIDPTDIKIRPDGFVYLQWTWFDNRLNKALGVLQWSLFPLQPPQIKEQGNKHLVIWVNALFVRGVFVGAAGGECSYVPSNYTMSYGDAIEGARSNALSRNCKHLGIPIDDLFDETWVNAWKKKYAETYKDDKGKTLWRKKLTKMPSASQPMPDAVKAAVEEGGVVVEQTEEKKEESRPEEVKLTLSELRKMKTVDEMAKAFGVEKSVVVKALGKLEAGHSYTFDDVKKKIEETK